MARLKVYAVGNDGFVSPTVIAALGQPPHIRQASVYLIAHSKAEAAVGAWSTCDRGEPVNLTPTQRRVLQAAADGDLYRSESGFDLYACYIRGERRKVTAIVERLNQMEPRLLRIGEQDRFIRPWHLTDAGREALGLDPEENL